jgi:hypothetical protein
MDEYRVKPRHNRWVITDEEGYPALARDLFDEFHARQIAELLNRDLARELNHGQAILDRMRRADHS